MASRYTTSSNEFSLIPLFLLYRISMEPLSIETAALQVNAHGFELDTTSVSRMLRRLEARGYITAAAEGDEHPGVKAYRVTSRGRLQIAKARAYIRDLAPELRKVLRRAAVAGDEIE